MKDFKLTISKEEINRLPLYHSNASITVIEKESDALKAVKTLEKESLLGFDTETRAAFKSGESYDVSLLQLATDSNAYLFRLNKFPMIKEIADLLANPNIIKAGVAIRDDLAGLKKLTPFTEKNFIELAELAQENKIENFGLRALTAILLNKRLSKKLNTSNWERQVLTSAQISYAAYDAIVGHEIYKKLCD